MGANAVLRQSTFWADGVSGDGQNSTGRDGQDSAGRDGKYSAD